MSIWRKLDNIDTTVGGTLDVSDAVTQALLATIDVDTGDLVSQGVVANGLLGTTDTSAAGTNLNTSTLVTQGTAANASLVSIDADTTTVIDRVTTIRDNTSRSDGLGITLRSDSSYLLTPVRMSGLRNTAVTTYQSISSGFLSAEVYIRDIAETRVLIASSAVSDVSPSGTGARTVRITGVDASGVVHTEVLVMNGRNDVASSDNYIAINSVEVVTAGTSRANTGVLSVTVLGEGTDAGGVPIQATRVFSQTAIGLGLADTPVYAIPTGKSFYPVSLSCQSASPFTVQLRFTDLTTQTLPVERSLFEVAVSDTASAFVDLRSLVALNTGALHVLGKSGGVAADITFVLTGYVDT